MQLQQKPSLSFQGYCRQAWRLLHILNGTGKSQYSTGSNSRSCCRYNYLPEYPAFTHSQSSSCIDQIHIHLLKGRPGISIHQWKRDHRSCDHTSGPCLNYFNIKIVQQKTSKRPLGLKAKAGRISYCRRQNKRHCQNPIQHCPCSRFQFHDLPCTEYTRKKSKYSCCHTGFQKKSQRTQFISLRNSTILLSFILQCLQMLPLSALRSLQRLPCHPFFAIYISCKSIFLKILQRASSD